MARSVKMSSRKQKAVASNKASRKVSRKVSRKASNKARRKVSRKASNKASNKVSRKASNKETRNSFRKNGYYCRKIQKTDRQFQKTEPNWELIRQRIPK